ncbi:hypothetical protein [Microbacterium suwonense]|uniref:Uncharacterized protein n=1 Tax=Microbacterium suwonense TaxID=683047 RepID=A0ABM8FQA2_9MICO|nr:hypothetical protein [Microbacterium suwonense]BDZ37847.1 hypothetical protein GCM10025863_04610 [Microbacterium suwonense]
MTAQHPPIDDPDLGLLTRAESTFDDGTVAVHDWYAGRIDLDGDDVELMIDGPDVDDVRARLPGCERSSPISTASVDEHRMPSSPSSAMWSPLRTNSRALP